MLSMLTKSAVAAALLATPIAATAQYNDRYDRDDRYEREYRDRQSVSREELRRDRQRIENVREDYRDALRSGDRRDQRDAKRDLRGAYRELAQDRKDYRTYQRYDYNRPDPRVGRYYADNYYRDGSNYQPRRLRASDRVYRGRDNRYYCRRDDGTTGLIIGAVGGGFLGDAVAPGGSKTLGAILGAVGGGALGRSIDRNDGVRCR